MRRRRVLNAIGAAALLVIALAAGRAVADQLSESSGAEAPFYVKGEVGETVSLSYLDATVTDVRATDTLLNGDQPETTSVTFLIVDMELLAPKRSAYLDGVRLVSDGVVYLPTNTSRTGCTDSNPVTTGVPVYWMACFEIPDEKLEGAAIRIGRGDPESMDDRRDEVAEIDLGIDARLAEELAAVSEPLPASSSGIVPYPKEQEESQW